MRSLTLIGVDLVRRVGGMGLGFRYSWVVYMV